ELPPGAGLQVPSDVDHLVVIEVEAGHREVALRLRRLLLDRAGAPIPVERHDPIALGIAHAVAEDGGAFAAGRRTLHEFGEPISVEDVVTEHEAYAVPSHEPPPDVERLGQSLRPLLDGVSDADAPLGAISEQLLEARQNAGG